MADHAEFQELCALFSAGTLNEEEVRRLKEHLSDCADCRRYLEEFANTANASMSEMASKQTDSDAVSGEEFDPIASKKRLFGRIKKDRSKFGQTGGDFEYAVAGVPAYSSAAMTISRPSGLTKSFHPYLPLAAAFFLGIGLSLTIYWYGPRKMTEEFRATADRAEFDAAALREKASALSKQRDDLNGKLENRWNTVAALQNQNAQLQKHIAELEARSGKTSEENQELTAAKEALGKNVEDLQNSVALLNAKLDSSQRNEQNQSMREADLQRHIEQLSATLREQKEKMAQQDATIADQQDLLSHDRDIRDIMGARQLYVAEVTDNDEHGPKIPRARVFYTRGKSLIYYGFDLDKQPGLRNTSTFQAWGSRRGSNQDALNLGVLYQDSINNKRWILKIDDPMKLEQIDAVFLTMEPKGGSSQPTGRHMLFAYLRVDPNHP
jgi:hypothetical protein